MRSITDLKATIHRKVGEAGMLIDREKVIKGLRELEGFLFKRYGEVSSDEIDIWYDRFLAVSDALDLLKDDETQLQYRDDHIAMYQAEIKRLESLLKEQEAEAKWIYGEDKTGVDGWYCSECDFFEPWFYEFTDDIDFIRFYGYCPSCGRKMTSYTGKPTQSRR